MLVDLLAPSTHYTTAPPRNAFFSRMPCSAHSRALSRAFTRRQWSASLPVTTLFLARAIAPRRLMAMGLSAGHYCARRASKSPPLVVVHATLAPVAALARKKRREQSSARLLGLVYQPAVIPPRRLRFASISLLLGRPRHHSRKSSPFRFSPRANHCRRVRQQLSRGAAASAMITAQAEWPGIFSPSARAPRRREDALHGLARRGRRITRRRRDSFMPIKRRAMAHQRLTDLLGLSNLPRHAHTYDDVA